MCNATCQQTLISLVCMIALVGFTVGLLRYVNWLNSKLKDDDHER